MVKETGLSVLLQGNLGNQLWQYAVVRGVAEKLDVGFHIPRHFQGKILFPEIFMGDEQECEINSVYIEKGAHWHIQKYDSGIFGGEVQPNTRLVGFFQSERYLWDIGRDRIKQWFPVDKLPSVEDLAGDLTKTCVINFRGGDYAGISNVFLPNTYYQQALSYIKSIDPNIRFLVVTDDMECAKKFFPEYQILAPGLVMSFAIVSRAPYLVVANSSFSWWAAWLNDNARVVVAPKYWLRYNVSNGWWSPSDSLTMKFTYVDPKTGRACSALECVSEIDPNTNYLDYYR